MRILIVEDDVELARIVHSALTEKLYTAEAAHDGLTAKHLALSGDYSLIILDLMLPGIDGINVCHAIRGAGNLTPVLMLTARDLVSDRILGLDAGADDYLVKPFDIGELLARVRALLRRAEARSTEILTVGDLTLNPRMSYVLRGSTRISLTAKEFSLLQVFMKHPNQVLSRTEILESVWDTNYEGLGNVVEVYVNYLRNKLGAERIETVRGRGYVLRKT